MPKELEPGSHESPDDSSSPAHTLELLCHLDDTAHGSVACQIYCIENAHGQLVRDLDFNPNKQYYLASCGDDCKVKFWDTRNVTEPVKTLEEHSHWVWSVRYNHSHDQLVLTGSSDSRVILSNMVSISSEPFGHLVDDDDLSDQEERRPEEKSQEPPQDSVIATYEEHEDSVYAVDWSSADPWLFASLSYDGRLVINRVPRALKYHILL
uniref:EARP and GARP complex-interacting protein 1 n=2 Tax=Felis catus TaxID=9685 RepID=A0ABI7VQM8_FELCA